jgi:hypothetical protein
LNEKASAEGYRLEKLQSGLRDIQVQSLGKSGAIVANQAILYFQPANKQKMLPHPGK